MSFSVKMRSFFLLAITLILSSTSLLSAAAAAAQLYLSSLPSSMHMLTCFWPPSTLGETLAKKKKKTVEITSFGNGNQKLNFRLKTHFAFWLF